MKNLIIAALCIVFSSASFSQVKTASFSPPAKKFQNLIGVWEIVGEQDSGGNLEVVDSNTIFLRFMGEEKKLVSYKIDFSKSPYWFDFTTKDSSSTVTIKSLFEFINDDMVKWQVFMDEERSDHFSSTKGELLYLRRSKSSNGAYYTDNK
jgi:hypothetical protein